MNLSSGETPAPAGLWPTFLPCDGLLGGDLTLPVQFHSPLAGFCVRSCDDRRTITGKLV